MVTPSRCLPLLATVVCLAPAVAAAEVTYDLGVLGNITFPSDQSFADVLVAYDIAGTDAWCSPDAPQCPCDVDALVAGPIGPPLPYSGITLGDDGVSGGSITVMFTDNVLVDQSGYAQTGGLDPDADLFIYEGGGVTEGVYVSISTDGYQWLDFGALQSWPIAIDIGTHPEVQPGQVFRYVRLEEIVDGSTYDGQCWSGADIVSIGAIGSIDSEGCTHKLQDWWWMWPLPVDSLTLGGRAFSNVDIYGVIGAEDSGGDAIVELVRQMMVAELNIASGADGAVVADALAEGYVFMQWRWPPIFAVTDEDLELAEALTEELHAFNTGDVGPGACEPE